LPDKKNWKEAQVCASKGYCETRTKGKRMLYRLRKEPKLREWEGRVKVVRLTSEKKKNNPKNKECLVMVWESQQKSTQKMARMDC